MSKDRDLQIHRKDGSVTTATLKANGIVIEDDPERGNPVHSSLSDYLLTQDTDDVTQIKFGDEPDHQPKTLMQVFQSAGMLGGDELLVLK